MPEELIHQLPDSQPTFRLSSPKVMIAAAALIIAGVVTGFLLTKAPKNQTQVKGTGATPAMIKTDTEVGSTDTKTFRDTATGVIEAGGLNGEGTHKLIRDGGPSKTAYMISSVIDLDQYVGETLKAQRAPWLMDVGRLKLVE